MMIPLTTVVVLSTVYFSFHEPDVNSFAFAQGVNNNSSSTLVNLNGTWIDQGNHSVVISQLNTNLTIDMSALDRPSAYGSLLNQSTIAVIFPDDEGYNGKLVPPDKIEWSNNSTWKKETN
jgi:hypothetical protein